MSIKILELVRQELPDRCIGQLRGLNKDHVTLEKPNRGNRKNISCIPYGAYKVIPDDTGRWQFFSILDVEDRTFIEIHPATDVDDLEGCIAVSEHFTDTYSFYWNVSEHTCKELSKVLKEPFILNIRPFVNGLDVWRVS